MSHERHGHWPHRFLALGARVWAGRGVVALRCLWHRLRRGWLLERQRHPGRLGLWWRGLLERPPARTAARPPAGVVPGARAAPLVRQLTTHQPIARLRITRPP